MMKATKDELNEVEKELAAKVPEPLHTMLPSKQSKEEAKALHESRRGKTTTIVPPTCTGSYCTQI